MRSYSPPGIAQRDDGVIYFYELERRRLASNLVTLSGCNTTLGTLRPGERMAGLQYAFQEMSIPCSLATFWLSDDAATARFMTLFYRILRDGLPKDVALQKARTAFLAQAGKAEASLFIWTGPVLYCNISPVPLSPHKSAPALFLLLSALLASPFFTLLLVRRRCPFHPA